MISFSSLVGFGKKNVAFPEQGVSDPKRIRSLHFVVESGPELIGRLLALNLHFLLRNVAFRKLGTISGGSIMLRDTIKRMGNMRWGLAALILGLPLPIVIIAFLFGGCGGR